MHLVGGLDQSVTGCDSNGGVRTLLLGADGHAACLVVLRGDHPFVRIVHGCVVLVSGRVEALDGRTVHEDAGELRLVRGRRDVGDGVRVLREGRTVRREHVDRVRVGHALMCDGDGRGLPVLRLIGECSTLGNLVGTLV